MISSRFAAVALALVCAFGTTACTGEAVTPRSSRDSESQATSTVALPRRWMGWTKSEPGVSLAEAREQVGVPIGLPDASVVGPIKKVVLDDTASFESGHPGLLFLFGSGVTLSIQHRAHEMDYLGTDFASFTDGRRSGFETRTVDGVLVRVGEGGVQTGSHGENLVPAQVMWNVGSIGYRLCGPTEDYGTDRLIEAMRSFN